MCKKFEPKTHRLRSITDIISVINSENIETFKRDFSSFLDLRLGMKNGSPELENFFKISTNNYIDWIYDGKNNVDIKIKITK